MKLKYFIRGLGTGVVFTTLVVAISLSASSRNYTDEKIIEKARELGMVMESEINSDSYLVDAMTTDTSENTTESTPENTTEPTSETAQQTSEPTTEETIEVTTQTTTEIVTTEPTKPVTTEPSTTATTAVTTQATTQATTNTNQDNNSLITVEIKKGMWSNHVASYLENIGLIDSANDFDKFLVKNNYQDKIAVGVYKIKKGSSYDEIAQIVTN